MASTNVLLVLFIISFTYLHVDFAASSNSRCREIERKALMDFKGSLVDKYDRLSSWTGQECCSWHGITCDNHTGFVQVIDLSNDNPYFRGLNVLGGHINSSLLNLEHLEYLDLSYNNFSGIQIPSFLGSMRNLKYLDLFDAGFSGEIPQHLGNLSNLQHLSLGGFSSPFDRKLSSRSLNWITRLSSLKSLEFNSVNVSDSVGWLDSINMLPSLSSLSLVDCELVGMALSGDLNLTSIVSIVLRGNDFNTTLPPSFFNLSSLQDITIQYSYLRGPIPNMFQKLTSLNSLHLFEMSLASSIPNSLCTLTGLSILDLSDVELQSIPLCLGNLTNLTLLNLAWNKISGTIPGELGSLKHLNQLDLSNNHLSGRIPSTLGQLTELQSLDVSINSLIGEFSESFFEGMEILESLEISENHHIVFNVSPQWIPPFQLDNLHMDSVFLGLRPPFPAWLRTQTNLVDLSLRNVSISGVIPDWFQTSHPQLYSLDLSSNFLTGKIPTFNLNNKETLQTLELSNNEFTGKIPDELCNLRSMYSLKLANNQLIGRIPDELCNLRSMESLNLANNQLIGRIPSCMGNLQKLQELDLANNNLSGHIPGELGYLNQLYVLYLNGNMLFGELPSSLQNLTDLRVLNLGENALHGPIPNWIGKEFKYLEYLMLQSNNFSGEIPPNLCRLPSPLILSLADNNLVGTIPPCLGNLSMMLTAIYYDFHVRIISKAIELDYYASFSLLDTKFISLSGNQLHGNIPDELMDLTVLNSLNLSNNKLTGKIPERIGNMKHLESLDLSRNHLSGTIPQSLAGIDTLGYLNLSFNNLFGRIPSGGHFDTFDDPSVYEGNGELCGKPTTKSCDDDLVPFKQSGLVSHGNDDNEIEIEWLYAGIGPGFAVGFLGVFFLLYFKSSWRYRYFRFLENMYNRF